MFLLPLRTTGLMCVSRVKCLLEPLAVASKITQVAVCHLDQVLLKFGYLVMQYKALLNNPAGQPGASIVIASIEKR